MIQDLGTVRPGTTLYIPFHTFDSNDPSASVTMSGLAVTDIEVYKDGSTTQRASDAGYALLDTDGTDFDGITGIHGISINLADNTTAGFWAAGSQYWVVISSVTVDAATINFVLATFRIGYPNATLNTTIATLSSQTSFTLTSGPAEDDALNGMWCVIHDVASAVQFGKALISDYTGSSKTVTLAAGTTFTAAATDNFALMDLAPIQPTVTGRTLDVSTGGEAGVDWANVGSPTTSVGLTGTTISTSQAVASVSGAVGSVTGNVGGNVTGSVGSVTGAVGSVTGNVGGNVVGSVASVTATVSADVVSISGDGPAADNAEAFFDGTGYAGTNNVIPSVTTVTGNVNGSVGSVTGAVGSVTGAVGSVTAGVTVTTNNDKSGYSLTATTGLGNQTANITGNLSGSVGSVTGAVGSVTGNVGGNVTGSVGSVATDGITAASIATDAVTELRSIVSGTADSGSTTTMVDAARTEADTDYWKDAAILFTSGTISGQIRLITAFDAATDTITFSPATTQAVGTNTYEIIPNVAAAGASAPTAAQIADAVWDEAQADHVAAGSFGVVASEVADILVDTSTTLQAELDGIQADTEDIQTRLPAALVAGRIDASVGAMATDTLTAAALAADAVAEINATVDTALADYDAPTNAELVSEINSVQADIAALNNLSAAQVNAEVDTALADIHLDHLLAVDYDPASKPGTATALLNELVESDAGVSRFTANALEQGPSGGGGVADWTADERTAIRSILGIPASGTTPDDPSVGILDTIRDSVGTRASQTSVDDLPTNAELATALASADDATLAAIAGLNNLSAAEVNAEMDTALADINLDHLVKSAVDTDFPTTVHLNSVIGHLADNGTSATFDRTTDSLEALQAEHDATQVLVNDVPTNAELATALGTADDATLAAIAALNNLSQADIRTAIGLSTANLDTQIGDLPTNAELATALGTADDAVLAAIAALNNLSSAQAQTAAAAALTAYDPPTRTEATADKDEVLAAVADVPTNTELTTALDAIPTATENADELLKRDWDGLTGEAARSVLNALRFIRNKWSVSGTTLTVTKEDDTTAAWTSTVTTNASADPITGNDPA